MKVIVNYKNGEKRVITADDIDMYRDHKDVKAVYECYDWFGDQREERIL